MNIKLFTLSFIFLFNSILLYPQWIQKTSGTTKGLYTVHFINENIGWAAGEDGTILKTIDGGETWLAQSISTPDKIRSIFFTDSLNGWIALFEWTPFRHGSVYHTTDGGNTWYVQLSVVDYALLSLFFTDNLHGWVVGTNGIAFKTTNGGNTWQQMFIETYGGWLFSVRFINDNIGWVAGDVFGQIPKTTNSGSYWFAQYIPTYYYLVDIFFIDEFYGWGVGQSGVIVTTTNGGSIWSTQSSGVTIELRDVHFIKDNKGWVAGLGGIILYSDNGGVSWYQQNSNTTNDLYAVFFIDEFTGWIVGNNGLVLKTNNGGIPVELVSFNGKCESDKVLLSWSTASEINNSGFEIQRRKEGEYERIGFVEGNGTTTENNDYLFVDKDITPGTYHYRLKQINYDGSFEYSNEIEVELNSPLEFVLEQNFPNPFNPITTIEYSVPSTEFVSLNVYNSMGEIVNTLVNEQQSAGKYTVRFESENLASGIYLYKIKAGDFVETKKMALMK